VQGYTSEADKAAARTLALGIIADYRDRGCPEPEPIDAAQWMFRNPRGRERRTAPLPSRRPSESW